MSHFKKENAVHLSHLHNCLIKCILKTFTCLQFEMYLILCTKANQSHTTSTNKIVLQRNILRIYDVCVFENIEWFSTNKSVYEREHWQKSPRIVIHAYNVCGHDIHRNIVTLWMELNTYRFFFETFQPLIWWNIFSRLLTHRLTTAVVMFNGSRLCFVLTTLETNIITD